MAWSLVEVYGTWGPDDDHRGEGRWVATLPDRLTSTSDANVLQAGEYRSGKLDPRGSKKSLSFMAPAIDDPTVTPASWGPLDLLVLFQDGSTERYAISAPYAARPVSDGGSGAGLNLKTLDPVTSAPGPTLYPRSYVGTGSPEGSVTAEPGSYYTDTDGSDANWLWVKTTGSGDTGWEPSIGTSSPAVLGGGGDAELSPGDIDVISTPHAEWRLSEPSGKARQLTSQKATGGSGSSSTDEFAPLEWSDGGVNEWRGGNHGTQCWNATTGAVGVADIGTAWTDGAGNYTTLLHYEGGVASFSRRHNAAGDTFDATAPTGMWTASGGPSLDFTALAPTYVQHARWDVTTAVQAPWRAGRNPMARHGVRQEFSSQAQLVAYASANPGALIPAGAAPPAFTLDSLYEWRGGSPNVVYIKVTAQVHVDATITQWSGVQAAKWAGKTCLPGTTGTAFSGGLTAPTGSGVLVAEANWVDGVPPMAMLTSDDVLGGLAVGTLSSPIDRSVLTTAAAIVNSSGKLYPVAVGSQAGSWPAGSVLTCRAFRSVTTSSPGHQLHIVPDHETDTVYWWAAADAAGIAANPLASDYLGHDLVVDRTSGITVGKLTPDGVSLSGAGWAEGRLTKPTSVTPARTDVLYGAGSPEGVVTAEVGTEYRDTAGTFGAWVWLKTSGSGSTGWEVTQGDTGWRDVSFINGWVAVGSLVPQVRRVGRRVRFMIPYRCDSTAATSTVFWAPSAGFGVPVHSGSVVLGWLNSSSRSSGAAATQGTQYAVDSTPSGLRCALTASIYNTATIDWYTDDAWPTAWPT